MPLNLSTERPLGVDVDFGGQQAIAQILDAWLSRVLGQITTPDGSGLTASQETFLIEKGLDPAQRVFWLRSLVGWVASRSSEIWPGKSVGQVVQELNSRLSGETDADRQLQIWLDANFPAHLEKVIELISP
jgi:hypothetical protein